LCEKGEKMDFKKYKKINTYLNVAAIVVAAILISYSRKEDAVRLGKQKDGIYRYTESKQGAYAFESIQLNDTLLRIYDGDMNKIADGVYYENNFPACNGKLGVDDVFYQKAQDLDKTGSEYGDINFKLSKSTIDLATKIYNEQNVAEDKKSEWRKDVRNLVQMVNSDYEVMRTK
jgi:hypothetical protein